MDDTVKTLKDIYDQGYKQGYIKGIKHMKKHIARFVEELNNTSIEAVEKILTNNKGK